MWSFQSTILLRSYICDSNWSLNSSGLLTLAVSVVFTRVAWNFLMKNVCANVAHFQNFQNLIFFLILLKHIKVLMILKTVLIFSFFVFFFSFFPFAQAFLFSLLPQRSCFCLFLHCSFDMISSITAPTAASTYTLELHWKVLSVTVGHFNHYWNLTAPRPPQGWRSLKSFRQPFTPSTLQLLSQALSQVTMAVLHLPKLPPS